MGWLGWVLHWLAVHTGVDNESGPWYAFWSGFGSDLGEVTIVVAIIGWGRHANCHSKGCWRFGRHPVDGTPFKVCRRCHPLMARVKPTREIIHAHHAAHVVHQMSTGDGSQ